MTARDVTFSPPGNRATFSTFWSDYHFLTRLHRKPGEEGKNRLEETPKHPVETASRNCRFLSPCRGRTCPDVHFHRMVPRHIGPWHFKSKREDSFLRGGGGSQNVPRLIWSPGSALCTPRRKTNQIRQNKECCYGMAPEMQLNPPSHLLQESDNHTLFFQSRWEATTSEEPLKRHSSKDSKLFIF